MAVGEFEEVEPDESEWGQCLKCDRTIHSSLILAKTGFCRTCSESARPRRPK